MKKLRLGRIVEFQARHGEVIGPIVEIDKTSIVVASDMNPIYRYRIPIKFALESETFKVR